MARPTFGAANPLKPPSSSLLEGHVQAVTLEPVRPLKRVSIYCAPYATNHTCTMISKRSHASKSCFLFAGDVWVRLIDPPNPKGSGGSPLAFPSKEILKFCNRDVYFFRGYLFCGVRRQPRGTPTYVGRSPILRHTKGTQCPRTKRNLPGLWLSNSRQSPESARCRSKPIGRQIRTESPS